MKKMLLLLIFSQFLWGQILEKIANSATDPKLELQWEIGGDVDDKNQLLIKGIGIVVDEDNCLYMRDMTGGVVKKYDAKGKFLKQFGRSGRGPGEYIKPSNISIGENGKLLVSQSMSPNLVVFDKNGSYLYDKKLIKKPTTILYAADKYFYMYTGKSSKNNQMTNECFIAASETEFEDEHTLLKQCKDEVLKFGFGEGKGFISTFDLNIGRTFLKKLTENKILIINSHDYSYTILNEDGNKLAEKIYDGRKKERLSEEEKERRAERNKKLKTIGMELKIPEFYPYFNFVHTDGSGNFLVQTYEKNNKTTFHLFNENAKFIKLVKFPTNVFNYHTVIKDDYIYSVVESEDEFPVIRKYKIIL